jgi:hypothetical protein
LFKKKPQGGPLNLKVEDKFYRSIAGSGGTGGIKSVTNYAPVSISIVLAIYYIVTSPFPHYSLT